MQVKLPTLPLLSFFALTATALLAAPAPPTSFAEARQAVVAFATPAAAPPAAPKVQLAAATPATRTAAATPAAHVQPEGLMAIHRWLKPGEFAWDDEGVPPGRVTIASRIPRTQLGSATSSSEKSQIQGSSDSLMARSQ